ncbi:chitinase [Vibrio variabilis]|uniref:Chitinase n=1 Tax=Vibrio variabilis TaxID=990271 RepID=A0ABQ0J7P2_9VIBR|nr:chitinase [Vibrio variabilis]
MTDKFNRNLKSYRRMLDNVSLDSESTSYPGYSDLNEYDPTTVYTEAGNVVKLTDGSGRYGVFQNKWWTQGDTPSFKDRSGPWSLIAQTDGDGRYLSESETTLEWDQTAIYNAKDKVIHYIDDTKYNFKAKYWTKGDAPILTESSGIAGVTAQDWTSPWEYIEELSTDILTPDELPDLGEITPPICYENCDDTTSPGDPTLPPIIPEPIDPDTDLTEPPIEPEKPVLEPDTNLPESGYAFLRELTVKHWDWLFPMRSGRYNPEGGTRNTEPFAKADGSTDVFTLDAFKEAVIEYNAWAGSKGINSF